jgi:hypothetical protein
MKFIPILILCPALLCSSTAFASDPKKPANQAGNGEIDLEGTVLIVRSDIRQALGGADMGPGYIAVRIKVTPKSDMPVRISPDDFTLLSRKDGERGSALSPHQIAGGGTVLVVKPAVTQPGGDGTTVGGPVWGGVSLGRKAPSSSTPSVSTSTAEEDAPLLQALTEKSLSDKDIKTAVEGLLYFAGDVKLKPKDLSLIYQGQAGKLVIDFK